MTFARAVALLSRRIPVLFGISALVFVPGDLLFAAIDDTRAWGDVAIERLLAGLVVFYLANILAFGACIAALGDGALGLSEAIGVVLRRFAALIVVTLVISVGILLGLLALVVPGVLLLVWWWVSYQAIVLEGVGWREALGRSRALARGHFWPILVVAAFVCGGYVCIEFVLVWTVGRAWLPDFWSAWVMGALTDTLAVPPSAAATTALYFELRESRRLDRPQGC